MNYEPPLPLLPTPACHYCERPAIAYCDFVARTPVAVRSCDRALCPDHRNKVGYICDRSRRTKNNQSDTIDHCKEHGT